MLTFEKTILQEQGIIHCNITIWFTNLFLCLKQWRYPQKRQQWIRNGKNWRKFRRGTWRKSEVRKRWSMKQGRRAQKFIFPHWWDICHLRKCRIGGKAPKIQRSSCTPRRHCERWYWILCSIHWTRIISIWNDGSKSHGYHIQIARVRTTSSWRSICSYPGKKWNSLQNYLEFKKIWMSRQMDPSTTTRMSKIMVQYGRPSRSSWKESVRSSFGRTVMGKAIWENPIEIRLGESGFHYIVKKGYSYLCMWMTSNWLERNKI